jgi:hypothetical protein
MKRNAKDGSKVLYYYEMKFIFPQLRCARGEEIPDDGAF